MHRSIDPSIHPERAPSYVLGIDEALQGMVWRELVVMPREVVYVKSIVEASEGVCSIFGERGGRLLLAAAPDREADLDALVDDLRADLAEQADGSHTDGGAHG